MKRAGSTTRRNKKGANAKFTPKQSDWLNKIADRFPGQEMTDQEFDNRRKELSRQADRLLADEQWLKINGGGGSSGGSENESERSVKQD